MKTIYQNGRYRYIRKVGSPAYKIQKRFLWVFWLNYEHRYNSYGYDGLESDMVPWVVYSKQEAVNIVNMLGGKVEPMLMRKTSTRWPEEIEALNQEQRKELEVWLKENFETDLLKLYEVEEGKNNEDN